MIAPSDAIHWAPTCLGSRGSARCLYLTYSALHRQFGACYTESPLWPAAAAPGSHGYTRSEKDGDDTLSY